MNSQGAPEGQCRFFRLSSELGREQINLICKARGWLAFPPSLASSEEELRLASVLAEKSVSSKTSIAHSLQFEFLLWLSGEREIRKALLKTEFSPNDFFLACFGDGCALVPLVLEAKSKPLGLAKKASALEIERISLGRL